MYLNTNITSNNLMLNFSSPKLVDIKHKFKMACFNFERLYQKAVDTMLIVIMVESLKYCQTLYENVYFVPLQETLEVKMDRTQ